ncbi:MAG TPA: hypothetical protein VFZ31_03855 [Vicinamibacterales bacterium]
MVDDRIARARELDALESSVRMRAFVLALPSLPAGLLLLLNLLGGGRGPIRVLDFLFPIAALGGVLSIVTVPLLIGFAAKNAGRVSPATNTILVVLILAAATPLIIVAMIMTALSDLS